MNSHFKILDFALSSLLRRKYKNIALLVVYAFTVSVLGSILFLTTALKKEATLVFQDAPELIVQKNMAGRHDLIPLSYIEKIEKIPGVGKVKPRYWGYYYDPLSKANYTLMATSPEAPPPMLQGTLPPSSGYCAIGNGVKLVRNTDKGEALILVNSNNLGVFFEVSGTFQPESNLLTNDLVLLTKEDFLSFFNFPAAQATDLSVQVYNPSEIGTIAGKIKTLFPETRPITRSEILRTYDSVFNWRSGMLFSIFVAALIAFSILAWDKATGISGAEKQEIGILKAIGWDTGNILELKFWEGLIMSSSAFLIGILTAYFHVFFFEAAGLAPIMKGWSVLFPAFKMSPGVDPYQILVVASLTITPYVACTVFPSWKAAITDPETVMRS